MRIGKVKAHSLALTVALLLFGSPCVAQVSTMGTTAMGLPTTPGTIVSSPLTGPGSFSALTQPGVPDTTLAPVPLALDPTTPGTVVTCSSSAGLGTPSTPAAMSTIGNMAGTSTLAASAANNSSTTGSVSLASPLGGSTMSSTCSSTPGGLPINGAALPLSLPVIAGATPAGSIEGAITELGGSSLDPVATVPTPNASACSEGVTMDLATPGMMAPANATGAAATPGVSPAGC
jgi:hypothetical protein